ncbi:hypothetical protein K458DRAFT_11279 [Lentithecium fluviatile CBS 122367]|uniref:Rhodopsin domain-containing protein n=1 Tax=Lentithecium fluviatile CBS 122367 TaxID=1168545 RepID=A0A6G1JQ15_9PLEO|nr:hypothetical protein K458DRAFT_11279 [Lentithecium fluviatile CBS 122367]
MNEQRSTIVVLNVCLITLTLAATASRVWRRVVVVKKFNLQDGLIVLACVAATIFSTCQIIATNYGLGLHMEDIDMTLWPTLIKILMASNTFYFLCNWSVKHALLLFYHELATTPAQVHLISLMHFIAFGFGVSSILVDLFQCQPIRKKWAKSVEGWCADENAFYYANAGIMLATDCVLYSMPLVFTRGLTLRWKQRWGLRCLFGLGGLVIAASVARVYSTHLFATRPDYPCTYAQHLGHRASTGVWRHSPLEAHPYFCRSAVQGPPLTQPTDRFANVMLWAVIENHVAIVVACAPSIKVVLLLVFSRLASSLPRILSRFTPSCSRHSTRLDLEIAEIIDYDDDENKDGQSRGCKGTKGKLEVTLSEPALPSPMTPVFLAGLGLRAAMGLAGWGFGKNGRRPSEEEWLHVREQSMHKSSRGHSIL